MSSPSTDFSPLLPDPAVDAGTAQASGRPVGPDARPRRPVARRRLPVGEPALLRRGAMEAPLSFGQEGLWFVEQLDGPSGRYNNALALHLSGGLSEPALRSAFGSVLARHEVLRSVLRVGDGDEHGLAQAMPGGAKGAVEGAAGHSGPGASALVTQAVFELDPQDLPRWWSAQQARPHAPAERQALIDRWLHRQCREPVALGRAPLLRVSLLRLAAREHVLVVVAHHVVFDGGSAEVLMGDLSALYAAHLAGGAEAAAQALPPLPVQFSDYAVWQRQRVSGPLLERQRQYWTRRLDGLEALELPTDRPRPARLSHRGALCRFTLPAALVPRLKGLAQQENATLFMLLLAAFQALLMRHSRQTDVAVGIPVPGRKRAELVGLIGHFANSLVLRTGLEGDAPFTTLLACVRQSVLEAYAHADLPFDRLVAELRPQRDLARHPLYQVAFALHHGGEPLPALPGVVARALPLHTGTARHDLSLTLRAHDGGGLGGVFEYACDLFDAATVEALAERLVVLLEGVVQAPSTHVNALPSMTAAARALLLAGCQGARRDWPVSGEAACAHRLIEAQARRTPAAFAVRHGAQGSKGLTYGELNRRANLLAHRLRALGVAPGVFVGVCLPREIDLPVALLAVLKAGGAYVPLDPLDPPPRRAHMREDCAARVLVAHSGLRGLIGEARPGEHILWLDLERDALYGADVPALGADLPLSPAMAGLDDVAYVIYTSGSTGRPKGVMVPHRGLSNHVQWLREALQLTPDDRLLHKTSIGFDASLVELVAPLACGASVVLADAEAERDSDLLVGALSSAGITVLQMVPSALRALLAHPGLDACTSLRFLVCGGEALDRDLAREARRRLPATVIGNFYGPTEASIDSCWHVIGAGVDDAGVPEGPGTMPIGRPVANTRCLVLDELLQPVPQGVPGELCVGGASLARGYLNQPQLSAERFIPDPHHPGERLYRTGDLARYLANGEIEYLGRLDSQVKLRGYRIETGEIEATLNACDGVRGSAVVLREDRPGHRQLVAYLVIDPAGTDTAVLREALRARLPEHMLPGAWVVIDALPRLPNGKLDRRALPAPLAEAAPAYVAPRTPLERTLAELWCEVLGLARVGLHDHFFELGGHSLLAARLVSQVRRDLQPRCSIATLFKAPTLEGFALALERLSAPAEAGTERGELIALQPLGSGPPLFCICGVHLYLPLARLLAPDHPVYGVFLPYEHTLLASAPGGAPQLPSVEQMAADYAREVQRQQPHGPYHLLGVSFGGLLAYEVALQLRAAGETVSAVTVLDFDLDEGRPRSWPQRLARGLRAVLAHWRDRAARSRGVVAEAPTVQDDAQRLIALRDGIYEQAIAAYVPQPYGGRVHVVRAEETLATAGHRPGAAYGWERHVRDLCVEDVPGGHLSMLAPPHVQGLAARVRRHLSGAAEAPPVSRS